MSKFRITCAPLPPTFRGTPQQFLDAFVDGLEISTDAQGFSTSPTMPEGNVGPWFKNGREPYVWDEDTSTYVALDVSSSSPPQITAGENAPDPTVFPLWLKLSGNTVVGLFNYAEGQWVSEPLGIPDLSIGSTELANGAVTGRKIKPLAVTELKLATGFTFDQWEVGPAKSFVRVDPTAQRAEFRKVLFDSGDLAFLPSLNFLDFPHNLGVPPHKVQVVMYNKTANTIRGVAPGEEVVFDTYNGSNGWIAINELDIQVLGGLSYSPAMPDGTSFNPVISDWGLRIYYSAP